MLGGIINRLGWLLLKLLNRHLKKQLWFHALFKEIFNIQPENSFDSIYLESLHRYLSNKEKAQRIFYKIFENREVRTDFRRHFYGENLDLLLTLDAVLHTSPQLRELKKVTVNIKNELLEFTQIFDTVLQEVKDPTEISLEKKIDKISISSNKVAELAIGKDKSSYWEDLKVPEALRERNMAKQALLFLEEIASNLEEKKPSFKYKVYATIGNTYLNLLENEKAASYYIKALQFNTDDEKALALAGLGYLIFKEKSKAESMAHKVLEKNPFNVLAYSILINLWADEINFPDIEKKVPAHLLDDDNINYQLARVADLKGYRDEAIHYYEKGYELNNDSLEIKSALGSLLLSKHLIEFDYFHNQISLDDLKAIQRGKALLEEAWSEVYDSELKVSRVSWLVNIAIANKILQNFSESLYQFQKAYEIDPSNTFIIRHLFISYFEQNDLLNARKMLLKCQKLEKEDRLPLILFEAQIEFKEQNYTKCHEICSVIINSDDTQIRETATFLRINCLIRLKEFDAALEECDFQNKNEINQIRLLILKSKIYNQLNDKLQAISCLNKAANLITVETNPQDIYELTTLLIDYEKYDIAIKLLEGIVNTSIFSNLTKLLLNSYFNEGNYLAAIQILDQLKLDNEDSLELILFEADLYLKIRDYETAESILQKYLRSQPDNHEILMRLCNIYHLTNEVELLSSTVLKIKNYEYQKNSFKYQLAFHLFTIGNWMDSMRILYDLRSAAFHDEINHTNFVQHFIKIPKEVQETFMDLESVEYDTSVYLLNNETNVVESKTVLDKSVVNINANEVGNKSELGNLLIGKKKRAKVITTYGVTYVIEEIVHKFVKAFRDSMVLLTTEFRETSGFKMISTRPNRDSEDTNPNFDFILHELQKAEFFESKLNELYRLEKIPIGSYCRISKTSSLKVYNLLTGDENLGVNNFITSDENNQFIKELKKGKAIVLNPIACLTFYSLINEQARHIPNDLYVSQSFVDEINELIREWKDKSLSGEHLRVQLEAGRLFNTHFREEDSSNIANQLISLKNWIQECSIAMPDSIDVGLTREEKDKLNQHLGESFINGLHIAKMKNYLLLSDDYIFNQYAKANGIISGGNYSLLFYLREIDFISEEELNEKLIFLLERNYKYINPNLSLLLFAFEKAQLRISNPILPFLHILIDERYNYLSVVNLIILFLKKVYLLYGSVTFERVAPYFVSKLIKISNFQYSVVCSIIEGHFKLLPIQSMFLKKLIE